MECSRQLYDLVECDSSDDSVAHCSVQEEMLQSHPRMAHSIISDATLLILILVYRVRNFIIIIIVLKTVKRDFSLLTFYYHHAITKNAAVFFIW